MKSDTSSEKCRIKIFKSAFTTLVACSCSCRCLFSLLNFVFWCISRKLLDFNFGFQTHLILYFRFPDWAYFVFWCIMGNCGLGAKQVRKFWRLQAKWARKFWGSRASEASEKTLKVASDQTEQEIDASEDEVEKKIVLQASDKPASSTEREILNFHFWFFDGINFVFSPRLGLYFLFSLYFGLFFYISRHPIGPPHTCRFFPGHEG